MLYFQGQKSTSTKIKEKKYTKVLKGITFLHYCKSTATDCQETSDVVELDWHVFYFDKMAFYFDCRFDFDWQVVFVF